MKWICHPDDARDETNIGDRTKSWAILTDSIQLSLRNAFDDSRGLKSEGVSY
jgi:hypothetical protein